MDIELHMSPELESESIMAGIPPNLLRGSRLVVQTVIAMVTSFATASVRGFEAWEENEFVQLFLKDALAVTKVCKSNKAIKNTLRPLKFTQHVTHIQTAGL